MDRYNVVLVSPPGYGHAPALLDVGRLLACSFRSLGLRCELQVNTLERRAVNVVLGYHLIDAPSVLANHRVVIYQLEQLSDREGWFGAARRAVLEQAAEIWDYSHANVEFLHERGLGPIRHLPVGFHEALCTIPDAEPEIDVLFYGSINERRRAVLEELAPHCRLRTLFGVYGRERDGHIARSRVVLNVHYYERQIMEQVRVSYLLNNRRFVLSEASADNPYGDALATAARGDLVATCLRYLARPEERERLSAAGHECLRCRPMPECLQAVLAGPAPPVGAAG